MDAGELGVAQARRMARAAAHPRCGPSFDGVAAIVLAAARTLKYSEFETVVGRWESIADPDGASQKADACHAHRDAWIAVTGDGFYGGMQGSAVVGEALKRVLDQFVQAEWEHDWEWTKAQYGADACAGRMPRTDA
jgi:hypothetical protein